MRPAERFSWVGAFLLHAALFVLVCSSETRPFDKGEAPNTIRARLASSAPFPSDSGELALRDGVTFDALQRKLVASKSTPSEQLPPSDPQPTLSEILGEPLDIPKAKPTAEGDPPWAAAY
jgi:hypothetical protein